jgi:hypothetical protein
VNEPGLLFDKPLRLIGDEQNPANVIVEMSGSIRWSGQGGWIEGVTFRRPKMTSGAPPSYSMVTIEGKGRVDMVHSVFDNEGSTGSVVLASGSGRKGFWEHVVVRNGGSHGIEMDGDVSLQLVECSIRGNCGSGLQFTNKATFRLVKCTIQRNLGYGAIIRRGSTGELQKCHFVENKEGVLQRETGCTISCSSNTALVASSPSKNIPGFRITTIGEKVPPLLVSS